MPQDVDALTAPGGGQWVASTGVPMRVTVLGGDAEARRRLTALLGRTPGVVVVGSVHSTHAVVALDPAPAVRLDVQIAAAIPEPRSAADAGLTPGAPMSSIPATGLVRPALSARQREVLTAYSEANELLDVVARRLGMRSETLKTHLRRIRVKYREVGRPAPTRRDLYVRALEDGLVRPPG